MNAQNYRLQEENQQVGEYASYLSFKLDGELFATSVNHVQNIMEVVPITPVPKSPNHLKGVVNLRGSVVPVIDTKIKFGLDPIEFKKDTVILVLEIIEEGEDILVGALVDSVDAVFEASEEDIEPPPTVGSKYKSEYISGVIKKEDTFIHMIETEKLFTTNIQQKKQASTDKYESGSTPET